VVPFGRSRDLSRSRRPGRHVLHRPREASLSTTLLFVHGTGVRKKQYAETYEEIRKAVVRHQLPVELRGCFWGDTHGARLNAGGASVPGYTESAGGAGVTAQDEALALWAVLYTDPWYELRLLRNYPHERLAVRLGAETPADRLRAAVDGFEPSDRLLDDLDDAGLVRQFRTALAELCSWPELGQALVTAGPDPLEHRQAIARALIAHTLVAARDEERPALAGERRDALTERLTNELQGYGLGLKDFTRRQITGLVTGHVRRRRGSLTDAAFPFAGDVLRFLAHGDGVRDFVRSSIEDAPGDVWLLAHSLGGMICADLLIREAHPRVRGLITVGSQMPFLYEIGAFPGLAYPEPLPAGFPPWLNVYDLRDPLSYIGGGVLGPAVRDVAVDNGQPFPDSHSAYWTNRAMWAAVAAFLR
jgi:hypothetical protein